MIALFYSLAFHMHRSLGGWPSSIGERGFSYRLVLHAEVTMYYFMALFFFTFLIAPVLVVGSFAVQHLRRYIRYFGYGALSFIVCWGLMQLAPAPFLHWWRD